MADKTIPQLTEATEIDENALFAVDTGTQTFKLSFENLIASFFAVLNPTRSVRPTTDYDVQPEDRFIFCSGVDPEITMPPSAEVEGQEFTIKNVEAAASNVSIVFDGAEQCDGETEIILSEQYQFTTLFANGTGYDIVAW